MSYKSDDAHKPGRVPLVKRRGDTSPGYWRGRFTLRVMPLEQLFMQLLEPLNLQYFRAGVVNPGWV